MFWALVFYAALVFTAAWNFPPVLGLLLAFPTAYAGYVLGVIGLRFIVALGAQRFWPPSDTPPPPEDDPDAPASCAYVCPPDIDYPVLAHARGQCGWLQLNLRVDPLGRIDSFRVARHAHGRLFERAVAKALVTARLPSDPDATALREMTGLIVFIAPGKNLPDWAEQRFATAVQVG